MVNGPISTCNAKTMASEPFKNSQKKDCQLLVRRVSASAASLAILCLLTSARIAWQTSNRLASGGAKRVNEPFEPAESQ